MRNRPWITLALLAIFLGLIPAPSARAADLVVTNTNDDGLPGCLRHALANVTPGGTITFDLAPYPKTIKLTGQLSVNKDVSIQGPGEDNLTIDGDAVGRVFDIGGSATVDISGLTITNGKVTGAPAWAGCINNWGTLNLDDVTVGSCQAIGDTGAHAMGGAIYNSGTLHIARSNLVFNLAEGGPDAAGGGGNGQGGAIFGNFDAILTIEDSGFLANVARGGTSDGSGGQGLGGSIFLSAKTTTGITNTAFAYSTAEGGKANGTAGKANGGAIDSFGDLSTEGCWFTSNQAKGGVGNSGGQATGGESAGGAIHNSEHLTLINCSLDENTARGGDGSGAGNGGRAYGGGLAGSTDTKTTITGTTFKDNTAQGGASVLGIPGEGRGGGLSTIPGGGDASSVELFNSTLSGNSAVSDTGGQGGGIYSGTDASVELSFCTVAHNDAESGGGIYTGAIGAVRGPILKNTIVANNNAPFGPDLYNCFNSRGWNLIETLPSSGYVWDTSAGSNTDSGNRLGQDPKLRPLQQNGGPRMVLDLLAPWTHALPPDSPAIDHGSDSDIDGNPIATDQRLFTRPDAYSSPPASDIGAYERGAADLVLSKVAVPDQVLPGDTITFNLTCENNGSEWATGVVLTEIIPIELTQPTVVSSNLTITDTGASPPFVWQMADIAPGWTGEISLTAIVAQGLPAWSQFTNDAVCSTTEREADPASNQASAIITVLNAPPAAHDDHYRAARGTTLTVSAPGVLRNDSDANDDTLTTIKDLDPAKGTLTLNSDGSFTYIPADKLEGTVAFTYIASDGLEQSNVATVTIDLVKPKVYLPVIIK